VEQDVRLSDDHQDRGQAGEVGVLRVDAVHEDEPFSAATRAAVDAEIDDLARWLGLPLSSSR
jgi:hypothetical protein